MPVIPILIYGALAGSAVYGASMQNKAEKTTKGARELAERRATEAQDKLIGDQKAATELAAAQIEDRKRALARNKTIETSPLGVEQAGQKAKTVLGQ